MRRALLGRRSGARAGNPVRITADLDAVRWPRVAGLLALAFALWAVPYAAGFGMASAVFPCLGLSIALTLRATRAGQRRQGRSRPLPGVLLVTTGVLLVSFSWAARVAGGPLLEWAVGWALLYYWAAVVRYVVVEHTDLVAVRGDPARIEHALLEILVWLLVPLTGAALYATWCLAGVATRP